MVKSNLINVKNEILYNIIIIIKIAWHIELGKGIHL